MMAVPALAHQTAMIVRRFRPFRSPKLRQLHQESQNKENAENRFAQAGNHGAGMPQNCYYYSKNRNRTKNLCHIENSNRSFAKKSVRWSITNAQLSRSDWVIP